MSDPKLVDLIVPDGWTLSHHQLYELDPELSEGSDLMADSLWAYFFVQDLMQIESPSTLIDVGWYPEADPSGSFALTVLRHESNSSDWDWGEPVEEFETRSLRALVSKIQEVLHGQR